MPKHIRTYHAVKRFDMSALEGPLQLGTMVEDLESFRPLNRDDVVDASGTLHYKLGIQDGFDDSARRIIDGKSPAWAIGLVPKGMAHFPESTIANDAHFRVSCDSIVTASFDPDLDYDARTFKCRFVTDHMKILGRGAHVWMITGIMIARGLNHGWKLSGSPPTPSTASAVSYTSDESDLALTKGDVVVGYRVKRYSYIRASRNPFNRQKKLASTTYTTGANI